MPDVLCFGNLQLDVLCRTVTELPPPGGLHMIDAVEFSLSGNGGSLAMALRRLGVSVDLAGYSGADVIGDQFRAMLKAEGVGTDRLLRHAAEGTGTSVIALAPTGERSIFFVNGANAAFHLEDVPEDWLHGPRIVAVTSVFVLPQFTGQAITRLFQRAHTAGARTVLNIRWDREVQGPPFLASALADSDYFVLNYDEGRQLTGCDALNDIFDRLLGFTSGTIILTLGAEGCCFRTESELQRIPALPVQATDTTGAGDSFVAGFIAGLIRGLPLRDCVQLGCQVAAYAVTGTDGIPLAPLGDNVNVRPKSGRNSSCVSDCNCRSTSTFASSDAFRLEAVWERNLFREGGRADEHQGTQREHADHDARTRWDGLGILHISPFSSSAPLKTGVTCP